MQMTRRRVLVAGIGNVFLGDDGFGVEVVRRLHGMTLPEGVHVADFGVRGIHLAFELADGGFDAAILVDAVPNGGAPGTLYLIEPDAGEPAAPPDAHGLTPAAVLAWAQRLGGASGRVLIVGCEPESVRESMELSAPVRAAVDEAVRLVCDRAAALLGDARCA